jgi:hypothetical protein
MFIKARDKLIEKQIARDKAAAASKEARLIAKETEDNAPAPAPAEFRHNFMHNSEDDEVHEADAADAVAVAVVAKPAISKQSPPSKKPKSAAAAAAKKKQQKQRQLQQQLRDNDGGYEELDLHPDFIPVVVTKEEIEIAEYKKKLPSFLQDPPKKYNNNARVQFEKQLVFDIAISCCIPEQYIVLEEVKGLSMFIYVYLCISMYIYVYLCISMYISY